MKKASVRAAVLMLLAIAAVPAFSKVGAVQKEISILSLADPGRPVRPGDQIALNLDTHGEEILQVLIISAPEMILERQAPSRDGRFVVTIPPQAKPGRYEITAVGVTKIGQGILTSNKVEITIPLGSVGSITIQGHKVRVPYPGATRRLIIRPTADYTYSIQDPAIAIVDSNGYVTGEAAGNTEITASYKDENGTFSKTVPVIVGGELRGDLNDDHKIDESDVNDLKAWIGDPVNGPNDVRDLDHDGKITEEDVELLKQLCTYPECAPHPKRVGESSRGTTPASNN